MTKKRTDEFYRKLDENDSSTRVSSRFYSEDNETFKCVQWSQCLKIIDTIAQEIERHTGDINVPIGIIHENAFLWDMANLATKKTRKTLVGLNHQDVLDSLKSLSAKLNLQMVICSPELVNTINQINVDIILVISLKDDTFNIRSQPTKKNISLMPVEYEFASEIIYSSGSSGTPKIFYYSLNQILLACESMTNFFAEEINTTKKSISWMPQTYPLQRMLNLFSFMNNMELFYIDNPKDIFHFLKQIKPTYLASVPYFYQKVYELLSAKLLKIPVGRYFFKYALDKLTSKQLGLYDKISILGIQKIIHHMIAKTFGSDIKYFISGSAPTPLWLEYFFLNISLPIYQAYGLSENIIPISLGKPSCNKLASLGKIIPPNKIKITNGNIMMSSPGMHLNSPINSDEFFDTGDKGYLDEDGFLYYLGRESDYFKTSTGRRIYPLKIENCLKKLVYVNQVCALGEGMSFPCVIIDVSDSFFTTYRNTDKLKEDIKELTQLLNHYENPSLYLITHNKFLPGSEELTPNLKLRRKAIFQKYAPIFDSKIKKSNVVSGSIEVVYE